MLKRNSERIQKEQLSSEQFQKTSFHLLMSAEHRDHVSSPACVTALDAQPKHLHNQRNSPHKTLINLKHKRNDMKNNAQESHERKTQLERFQCIFAHRERNIGKIRDRGKTET